MLKRQKTLVSKSSCHAFTLLELIGVMVVLALLSAAVIPSLINIIRIQRSTDEARALVRVADSLKLGMLREQTWPSLYNGEDLGGGPTSKLWWNLAARHGGGSEAEVRYPFKQRLGTTNTRKIYAAKPEWSGLSFFEITGDGRDWLEDFDDPLELRLLLVSTTNSDLALPEAISSEEFSRLWHDWGIGDDGNPYSGSWGDYGLDENLWRGRAAEMNLVRIDLRSWLCTLVIENRRAIEQRSGTRFEANSSAYSGSDLLDDWDFESVYAYVENQAGSEVLLRQQEINRSGLRYTQIRGVDYTRAGRVVDESAPVTIQVRGYKSQTAGDPPVVTSNLESGTIQLSLTDRAPMALINPEDASQVLTLTGWENEDFSIQNRYFLVSQEILLGEPWPKSGLGPTAYPEVGVFALDEAFEVIRFDGLEWQY